MKNLLAFVTRYYHWFLFIFLEVISGVLLFRANNYQSSVWFTSANAIVGSIYRLDGYDEPVQHDTRQGRLQLR